ATKWQLETRPSRSNKSTAARSKTLRCHGKATVLGRRCQYPPTVAKFQDIAGSPATCYRRPGSVRVREPSFSAIYTRASRVALPPSSLSLSESPSCKGFC
ncbi:hypothetical protein MCOR08_003640, partial [Pyricularia oryzae]